MSRVWLLTVSVLLLGAAQAHAQVPPGFQTDLDGRTGSVHVECYRVTDSSLQCALYGAPQQVPGTCDFGGLVPTITVSAGARPAHGTICVDEGFHGWPALAPGRTWRSGAFRCRTHLRVAAGRVLARLECFAGQPRGFAIDGNGRSSLDAAPSRRRTVRSCGLIAFEKQTDNGVFGIRSQRASCVTARRVARASRTHGVARKPYRYRAAGFTCRGRASDVELPTVRWACVKRRSIVVFERS